MSDFVAPKTDEIDLRKNTLFSCQKPIVELRHFGGFSLTDIAEMWGMSRRTVQRDWEKARLFLHRYLAASDTDTLS